MKRKINLFIIVTLITVVISIEPAAADMRFFSMYELAELSDVVFIGKVTDVSKETASIAVSEMLSGQLETKQVTVSPTRMRTCTGLMVIFTIDDQVLIFGTNQNAGNITVAAEGHGLRTLSPQYHEEMITAAKRILESSKLDEHAKNKAMLALVHSDNERLSSEARHYIVSRIARGQQRSLYKDELTDLVRSGDPVIQTTGLYAIEYLEDPNLIPLIVDCIQNSNDKNVLTAASMALEPLDTPEATAALVGLTQYADPDIRIRAAVDLGNGSTQPEAKQALTRLLDDADPRVRAIAAGRFTYWFRHNQAQDVLSKLLDMLKDEDPQVCAAVAYTLGDYRNHRVVLPLLEVLKARPNDKEVRWRTLDALNRHLSRGEAKTTALIENEMEYIADILLNATGTEDHSISFEAVGILSQSDKEQAQQALQWASKKHPNQEIRVYAKRSLKQ